MLEFVTSRLNPLALKAQNVVDFEPSSTYPDNSRIKKSVK
jgi:hypothetical protein